MSGQQFPDEEQNYPPNLGQNPHDRPSTQRSEHEQASKCLKEADSSEKMNVQTVENIALNRAQNAMKCYGRPQKVPTIASWETLRTLPSPSTAADSTVEVTSPILPVPQYFPTATTRPQSILQYLPDPSKRDYQRAQHSRPNRIEMLPCTDNICRHLCKASQRSPSLGTSPNYWNRSLSSEQQLMNTNFPQTSAPERVHHAFMPTEIPGYYSLVPLWPNIAHFQATTYRPHRNNAFTDVEVSARDFTASLHGANTSMHRTHQKETAAENIEVSPEELAALVNGAKSFNSRNIALQQRAPASQAAMCRPHRIKTVTEEAEISTQEALLHGAKSFTRQNRPTTLQRVTPVNETAIYKTDPNGAIIEKIEVVSPEELASLLNGSKSFTPQNSTLQRATPVSYTAIYRTDHNGAIIEKIEEVSQEELTALLNGAPQNSTLQRVAAVSQAPMYRTRNSSTVTEEIEERTSFHGANSFTLQNTTRQRGAPISQPAMYRAHHNATVTENIEVSPEELKALVNGAKARQNIALQRAAPAPVCSATVSRAENLTPRIEKSSAVSSAHLEYKNVPDEFSLYLPPPPAISPIPLAGRKRASMIADFQKKEEIKKRRD